MRPGIPRAAQPRPCERGMTLMIALIMLMVITLFAVSMVRLGGINIAAVGNMQAQKVVETEANQAVEIGVGQFAFFDDVVNNQNAWAGNKASLTYAELWTNYKPTGAGTTAPATQSSTITVSRPQCTYFEPSTGYSALSGVAPQDTYWDMQVTATDSYTGATTEVHQGVRMRLPAGNCP